ncbi:MAG: hypothetical protein IV100_25740 [Myxococcales bacterium]|nr:hypothetical protein [Myxococcales bacterium]
MHVLKSVLSLALLWSGVALAGTNPSICDRAEITIDGRAVLLYPGCSLAAGFDLMSSTPMSPVAAEALARDISVAPLAPFREDGPFGDWMTGSKETDRTFSAWNAFEIPGTDYVIRYRRRADFNGEAADAVIDGDIQFAPVEVFREAFANKKGGPDAPKGPVALRAPVPIGKAPVADLKGVFEVGPEKAAKGLKTRAADGTYDPQKFKAAVPTFGDFVLHARYSYRYIGSDATSGWQIDGVNPAAAGGESFWVVLGFEAPGFRVVEPLSGEVTWSASAELHRIYAALVAGEPVVVRTYVPFKWRVVNLQPR